MKSRALLAALAVCLCFAACSTPEQPQSTTTAPADPNFKTVYVHTSVTQSSATVDARTEFLYDENDLLKEVIQYSGTNQTLRYQVQCDENGIGRVAILEAARGTYTVTELKDWSWRHKGETLTGSHQGDGNELVFTFDNTVTNNSWLNGCGKLSSNTN